MQSEKKIKITQPVGSVPEFNNGYPSERMENVKE
jgi:hypothetical protein